MQGAYIPLPLTRAERQRTKDPRVSIEERYQSRDQYLSLVATAARDMARQGYLLDDDVTKVVADADRHWKNLTDKAEAQK